MLEKTETHRCNKCGETFSSSHFKSTTHVNIAWGYNSMGKDTLKDSWDLCSNCTEEFESLPPVCAQCRKTIPEVMAYLYSESPRTSFYLDYPAALEYFKTSDNHCGYEYARIGDRILCEICYEAYVRSFKIPMIVGCYMGEVGPKEEFDKQPDRIQQAIDYVSHGDSLRDFYEARCNRADTVAIRASADTNQRLEALRVEIYKNEFKERWVKEGRPHYLEDLITLDGCLPTGERQYLKLTCRQFLEEAALRKYLEIPDFTKPSLSSDGKSIGFGSFIISSHNLIHMAQKYLDENKDQ